MDPTAIARSLEGALRVGDGEGRAQERRQVDPALVDEAHGEGELVVEPEGAGERDFLCDDNVFGKRHLASKANLNDLDPRGATSSRPVRKARSLPEHSNITSTMPLSTARLHGAAEIIVTDVVDEPLAVAMKVGADRTVNVMTDPDALAPLAVDKGMVDVMFECSGNERALRTGLELVAPRGSIVQVGLGGEVPLPKTLS